MRLSWMLVLMVISLVGWLSCTTAHAAQGAPSDVPPTRVPISTLMSDRHVPGTGGALAVHLDVQDHYKLQAVTIGGRQYAADDDFPAFIVLDRQGKRHTVSPTDVRWQVQVQRESSTTLVTYKANGLVLEVRYITEDDHLNVIITVRGEGDWRLISVSGTLLTRLVPSTSQHDYLVDGSGWLGFPDILKLTERKWDANTDNLIGGATTAAFVAWRERDRIVFVKPLTFSHWLGWKVEPQGIATKFTLRVGLYFRPPEAKLFETRLAHEMLAVRIETAGDINRDGVVDWVDAGVAYRERYIQPQKSGGMRHRLRDAFRVYYSVHAYPSYEAAFAGLPEIDFANGIWWSKGMMEPAFWEDWESHKFVAKPNLRLGPLEPWKRVMSEARQWVGPYYGHDYIVLEHGDWPDDFVKRDPDNQPYRYASPPRPYRTKYYKENVRSVMTGSMFRHYEQLLQTCLLQHGDPIMLDTFSAYARSGYHPEFPTTPELETEAKHRIADFLHNEKGLIVAGEGLVEGLQDVVDYGANAMLPNMAVKERIWEKQGGIQRVPMLPVVFQGASYYGAGWYEMRNPNPNWAIGLVYGVGYWDWLPQGPHHAWMRFARYYFNQNLIWAHIADAKVHNVEQRGSQFTITYDNGSILWADVEANHWVFSMDGVRYDGFTPFNNRGYMAVLTQGDFEITLPGEHQLEISPYQPFRDQIAFEYLPKEGRTVLRGRFGQLKWRTPILKATSDGKESPAFYDASPILVLRKMN